MSLLHPPRIPLMHPDEWHAFANAIIARGALESRLGVSDRYGIASSRYGCSVRAWPVPIVHELALAEHAVLETQRTLRRVSGVPEHLL